MSEAPELTEAEAFAAEHALGVLSGAERAEAELRMVKDPAFAADVEAWRARFAPLLEGLEPLTPPERVWEHVQRQLPVNDNAPAAGRGLRFWRGATAGSLTLAAASLAGVAFLLGRGPEIVQVPAPVPEGQLLSASLVAQKGQPQPLFVASYDPVRKALIVTSLLPEGADREKAHELWLLAGKDPPKSLGLLENGKAKVIALPAEVMAKMSDEAALAVSLEPPGGSPTGGPTGDIISVGKLAKL